MSQFQPQQLNYASPPPAGPNVRAVAIAQRRIMWVILGAILLTMSLFAGAVFAQFTGVAGIIIIGLLTLVRLALLVLMMICIYQLSSALNNSVGVSVVFVVLMLVPLVNLIVLLVLNQKATNYLKQNNIRVGLMGASLSDLPPA